MTTTRRSSATDLGAALVAALAGRDFGRLAHMLAPDVRMRALIPPGLVELSGAELAAARFASWFGESDGLELVHAGSDEVGDRLHTFYRLRLKRPGDPWKVVEQHLFCALDEGRIIALDLVCSGFRPDAARAPRSLSESGPPVPASTTRAGAPAPQAQP
jgi:SnoaL-like domain